MKRYRMRPRVFPLAGSARFEDLFVRLAGRRGVIALDSAGGTPRRTSLIAFDPLAGVEIPASLAGLRALHGELVPERGDEVPGPFHGGFVGALAYDLGVAGERPVAVAREPWGTPLVVGGLYTDFVVLDERTARAWLVLGDEPGDGRADVDTRRAEIEALLAGPACELEPARASGAVRRATSPEEHRARVEDLRERIAAGDLYQANLAHRLEARLLGDPRDLYARLRRVNPAPYMAWAAWDASMVPRDTPCTRGALLSASPELLLEFDGRVARTGPIKGTAPRGADHESDVENAAGLLASAKDLAELAMIVDLARNDLGAAALPGAVRVDAFPRLETYATVHHLVADTSAIVRPGVDAFELLARLFPGGSITGAPKLAAMDAIAALERTGRGFFTGSLGFVDVRGHASWNILIRTLVWRPLDAGGEISFHVGGGITWSSDPADEERETLFKGAGILRALEGA